MSRQSYFTIAVDVKGSTKQDFVTVELHDIAKMLNKKLKRNNYEKCLIPFTIRRGDEILAVFSSFSKGYEAYFELYSLLNRNKSNSRVKLPVYIGIGLGFIDYEEERDLDKINGSAMSSAFRARDIFLKNNKSYSRQYNQYNKLISTFVYSLDENLPYEVVNHLIRYINENYEKRTEKQKEVIDLIETNPEIPILEIVSKIGITESSVYKIIQRSNYQLIKDAQFSLMTLLDFIQEHYREGEKNV